MTRVLFCLLLLLCLSPGTVEAAKIRIKVDSPAGIEQNIYLTRPVHLAGDRPVVFVMHGVGRNSEE